jgi:hypothetical protein
MLCHVALVRTNVFEECISSIIRVTGIGELETKLGVTINLSSMHDAGEMFVQNVGSYKATWHNIPGDSILHSHHHENLKSYICFFCPEKFLNESIWNYGTYDMSYFEHFKPCCVFKTHQYHVNCSLVLNYYCAVCS